jgi:hypothetical protein
MRFTFLIFNIFFLNYQFFVPTIKNNALEHEGFIYVKILGNGYVHWMAMVDGISGMIKEGEHGIHINVKFHVLTLNFQLFRMPHFFFSSSLLEACENYQI